MPEPVSKIFYEGKQIVDKVKSGRYTHYVMEDETTVQAKDLGKIQIECNDCNGRKEISLYHKIYEKRYVCQSCNSKGEKNPFYGREHSQELKDRLSSERKGTWGGGGVGENNPNYGKSQEEILSPDGLASMKRKVSKWNKNRENNPFRKSMREVIGDDRFEESIKKGLKTRSEWSEEKRRAYSKAISDSQKAMRDKDPVAYSAMKARGGIRTASLKATYKMNKFEYKVYTWFTENNIEVEYSVIMNNGDRNFQYDFKIKGEKILIECQGGYWHGDPRFFSKEGDETKRKLNTTQLMIIEKDKKKKELADKHGFKLVYIWEHDIMKNNDFSSLEKEIDL